MKNTFGDMRLEYIRSLIRQVYDFDNTSEQNMMFISNIDNKLDELSDGNIHVRYWVVDGVLHCTPIYSNPIIKGVVE